MDSLHTQEKWRLGRWSTASQDEGGPRPAGLRPACDVPPLRDHSRSRGGCLMEIKWNLVVSITSNFMSLLPQELGSWDSGHCLVTWIVPLPCDFKERQLLHWFCRTPLVTLFTASNANRSPCLPSLPPLLGLLLRRSPDLPQAHRLLEGWGVALMTKETVYLPKSSFRGWEWKCRRDGRRKAAQGRQWGGAGLWRGQLPTSGLATKKPLPTVQPDVCLCSDFCRGADDGLQGQGHICHSALSQGFWVAYKLPTTFPLIWVTSGNQTAGNKSGAGEISGPHSQCVHIKDRSCINFLKE